MNALPFTPSDRVLLGLDGEAVFGARNPQLMLRLDPLFVNFRDGELRTSDPAEIAFVLGVVQDEARGNRGVWVKQLPQTHDVAEASAELVDAPSKNPRKSRTAHAGV